MSFSINRSTYQQKQVNVRIKKSKSSNLNLNQYLPLPNIKIPEPQIRMISTQSLGNKKLQPRSTVVVRKIANGTIGQNHPEEKLFSPEPLRSGSIPVHSTLPITRARKY